MSRFDNLADWLHWQENLYPRTIDLNLERAAVVFSKLNLPPKKPLTITIAGTNGKGSTVAFLEAIYQAQGYKVGSYTSPHILRYNERIKINGVPVSDEIICEACDRIDTTRGDTLLTYFEFGTLTALDIFARAQLDIQILEVGLGGRLDAVNILDTDAAIITSIDLDHTHWLGKTREAIGHEKSGIFRTDVPAIIGDLAPPQSVLNAAQQKQAQLLCIKQDFDYQKSATTWDWYTKEQSYQNLPYPVLKGEHQFRNASCALLAVTKLQHQLPVNEQAIHYGLQHAQLKGRFQLCIDDGISVLLDVGHNPQAVKTLVEHLDEHFADKKIHAVFAMMKDKDIDAVIGVIKHKIADWFVAPLTTARAADNALLTEILQKHGISRINNGFENCVTAFHAAKQQMDKHDLILIFGSFYLVSEYLALKE